MAPERKVKLKSLDHDEIFEVDEAVAQESQILKDLIEDMGVESLIPIPNVRRNILAKVLQYCTFHVEAVKNSEDNPAAADDAIKRWEQEFVKVDQATLLRLIKAANYLNIKKLLDLTCQAVADIIEARSPEEIRKTFKIKNDLTPEEEAGIRREHEWVFQ